MLKLKIMSLYAHPADHISEAGGTLALHADRGDDIVLVSITHGARIHPNTYAEKRDGDSNVKIAFSSREEIIQNKKDELKRAAEIIGVNRLIFLDFDDNYIGIDRVIVEKIAEVIAKEKPDIILTDYPYNANIPDTHNVASVMVLNALNLVSMFLENLDGKQRYDVKQIFMSKLLAFPRDGLSLNGIRNDIYIDTTTVIGRKIFALDQFVSQGYEGNYARKVTESVDGLAGKTAFVNFAEGFFRFNNETHSYLPLSDYAIHSDHLMAHRNYSTVNIRKEYPYEK